MTCICAMMWYVVGIVVFVVVVDVIWVCRVRRVLRDNFGICRV